MFFSGLPEASARDGLPEFKELPRCVDLEFLVMPALSMKAGYAGGVPADVLPSCQVHEAYLSWLRALFGGSLCMSACRTLGTDRILTRRLEGNRGGSLSERPSLASHASRSATSRRAPPGGAAPGLEHWEAGRALGVAELRGRSLRRGTPWARTRGFRTTETRPEFGGFTGNASAERGSRKEPAATRFSCN